MKLTLSFSSSRFAAGSKSQDKKLNILSTKIAFEAKQKAFFIIFKGVSVAKNYLRPESAPLIVFIEHERHHSSQKNEIKIQYKTKMLGVNC